MIPVNFPQLTGRERKYLLDCIKSGWISSEGPFVTRFEKSFASRVARRHGVAVANGTAALELAVAALDLPRGSEIILPALSIISCPLAVIRNGCVPVLVDSHPRTWNMDVSKIKEKITRKTKAIMAVHIYGLPVDMGPLLKLARRHKLKVIEDAAQMHGQTYRGQPCGSFGDLSTFSFYANKNVAMGEGGLIATDDTALAARCRSLRNLSFGEKRRYVHEELGFNYRLSNLQAAVGLAQLERLKETVLKKRQVGKIYTDALRNTVGLELPLLRTDYAQNIYWMYGVVLDDSVKGNAEDLSVFLRAEGIDSRPFFWPIHEQPVFRRMGLFRRERYPVAERLARRGLCLPSASALSRRQVQSVASAVRAFTEKSYRPASTFNKA